MQIDEGARCGVTGRIDLDGALSDNRVRRCFGNCGFCCRKSFYQPEL